MQITLKYTDESQDGRISITSKQKEEIRKKYGLGVKMQTLAEEYNVSDVCIFHTIHQEKRAEYREKAQTTWKDYYDKEKHRLKIKRYREKKRKLGFMKSLTKAHVVL